MCWALMAKQTTKTTSKLMCSPSNVFRSYMADLMVIIQDADIPIVAMGLYSNKIISENTRDKARISHRTKLEKNEDLLTAVEAVVSVQPQALDTFLNILNKIESASVDKIVQEMCNKLCENRIVHELHIMITYFLCIYHFLICSSLCSTGMVL